MCNSNKSTTGLLLLVATLCLAVISGCSDVRSIRIRECHVLSISPRGLTSVDATVSIELFNPGAEMTLYDMEAWIREDGRDLMKLTASPVTIAANSSGKYETECNASLKGGLSLFDIKNLVSGADLSIYYVDISLYERIGNGKGKPIKINKLPLKKIIGK